MLEKFPYRATTVFLKDRARPTALFMMRRFDTRPFAPGVWTGPGGKFDPGETEAACALRELGEETVPPLQPELLQIGRLIVNENRLVAVFTGIVPVSTAVSSNEGEMVWVPVGEIFAREILPTTRRFLEEWAARGWSHAPFTIHCRRDADDINSPVTEATLTEGLTW